MDPIVFDLGRALQPDMLVRYAVQLMLLCASAFFSGSETALFSLSHMDLRQLRRERHPRAGTLHSLLDEPRKLRPGSSSPSSAQPGPAGSACSSCCRSCSCSERSPPRPSP
jgi:hypothetical protein